MNPFVELTQAGVLMSYAPKIVDDGRRLPYYIDRILKGANRATCRSSSRLGSTSP